MRNVLIVIGVLLLTAAPAWAQSDYPKGEIFGGYSYINADFPNPGGVLNATDRGHLNGWALSFAYNPDKRVGLVAEMSGHYGNLGISGLSDEPDANLHTFLFGPRFSLRRERVTVFSHALVGAARTKQEDLDADTGFAIGVGGGLDVNVNKRIAVRLFQVDYLPVRSNDDWRHNGRVQVGVVFKIGGE